MNRSIGCPSLLAGKFRGNWWRVDGLRHFKRPMRGVHRALRNPLGQDLLLLLIERLVCLRGRHSQVRIPGRYPLNQFAVVWLAWYDYVASIASCRNIQPQVGLPSLLIESVTGITILGEDWQHVAAKIDRRLTTLGKGEVLRKDGLCAWIAGQERGQSRRHKVAETRYYRTKNHSEILC